MTTDQTPPNDTEAPERIIAWPNDDDRYAWMEGGCRSEDGAGAQADYGTWYVRADIAAAQAAAAWIAGRDAAVAYHQEIFDHDSQGIEYSSLVGIPISNLKDLELSCRKAELDIKAISSLTPPTDPAAALDRLIAEQVREAVEATWRDVEAALEKEINAEWFTSEVNGKPVTNKGETEFMRLTEAKRVFDVLKANVRAARGSKEGQS